MSTTWVTIRFQKVLEVREQLHVIEQRCPLRIADLAKALPERAFSLPTTALPRYSLLRQGLRASTVQCPLRRRKMMMYGVRGSVRLRVPSAALAAMLVLGGVAGAARAADGPPLKLTFVETSLGKLDPGVRGRVAFSADGRHAAYPVKRDDVWVVVVDGVESKPYDWVLGKSLVFCPDNKRVAFQVQTKDGMFVVLGDLPGKAFTEVMPPIVFSRDGARMAYMARLARKSKKVAAVVDGVPTKEYELITRMGFSPDGKRFAMRVEAEGKRFWVIDGKEGPAYDAVGPLDFSPDGRRCGYMAQRGLKQCMVIDGVEGKEYDKVGALVFNADGKRVVYAATQGSKSFVVDDGKEGREFDLVGAPLLSPDGTRLAYEVARSKRCAVVVDDEQQRTYEQVGDVRFSADGKHVLYRAIAERKWIMVLDGRESQEYDRIGDFAISPDGKRLAFGARRGTDDFLVLDGKELPGAGSVIMSPDGKYVAHAKDEPQEPGRPAGSVLYINATRGREYSGFLRNAPWVFEGNKLTMLAARDLEIVRVEVTIADE